MNAHTKLKNVIQDQVLQFSLNLRLFQTRTILPILLIFSFEFETKFRMIMWNLDDFFIHQRPCVWMWIKWMWQIRSKQKSIFCIGKPTRSILRHEKVKSSHAVITDVMFIHQKTMITRGTTFCIAEYGLC